MSRIKTLNGLRIRGVSPSGRWGKTLMERIILRKSQLLSSEWKTEQVREDESVDSEDDEDDELPCVIGGESEGDCVWRGLRSSGYFNPVLHPRHFDFIGREVPTVAERGTRDGGNIAAHKQFWQNQSSSWCYYYDSQASRMESRFNAIKCFFLLWLIIGDEPAAP